MEGIVGDITPLAMLVGFGVFFVYAVFAYLFYQFAKVVKSLADNMDATCDRDNKYLLFEEAMVDRFASEKGVDLKKEEIYKKELKGLNTKNFRKVVQEELIKRVQPEAKSK